MLNIVHIQEAKTNLMNNDFARLESACVLFTLVTNVPAVAA